LAISPTPSRTTDSQDDIFGINYFGRVLTTMTRAFGAAHHGSAPGQGGSLRRKSWASSVANSEATLDVARRPDLIDDGDRAILVGDPAPAVGVDQKLIAADVEAARALTGVDVR
jgi:hypothetical protein